MDIFVATQPIFDRKINVVAYELLHRESAHDLKYTSEQPDAASSRVISNLFESSGRNRLTGDKVVYINFTEELILNEIALCYPKDELVIEILESVTPSPEVIARCKTLKSLGYKIALDDFVDRDGWEELAGIADILKIDFLNSGDEDINRMLHKFSNKKILLAEKIESHADFSKAFSMGFDMFQGYFFAKPKVFAKKDIAPIKSTCFALLKICNRRFINFREIGERISSDVALTLKLLRLVNSCQFPHRNKIRNVQMALSFIGEAMVRRWVSLIAMTDIIAEKPSELMRVSLIRAKFGELLASHFTPERDGDDLFLLGMFSLLDSAMDTEFEILLDDIAIGEEIKEALIKRSGIYGDVLDFYDAYEHTQWDVVDRFASSKGIEPGVISQAFYDAMIWYNEFVYDVLEESAK